MAQDLMIELGEKSALLDKAITQLGVRGRTHAQAECDYRIARAKKILELRDNGFPATLILDLSRGDPEIARLRFERDVALTVYESAKEAINGYKLQIKVLDAQIAREWGRM